MAKPAATKLAGKRLDEILRSFQENPDVIQTGLIVSGLDLETIVEAGADASAAVALLSALTGKISRNRQGDHLFVHALVHIPQWLRDHPAVRIDPAEIIEAALSAREVIPEEAE